MNYVYILISYLLGSIPSGLIIGKLFKDIDIREHGSGNLGGTNAIRVLGKKLGTVVGVMDVLKGGLAVLLAMLVYDQESMVLFNIEIDPIIYGMFAVIGHVFPIFAGFRGGKAVATSGGVLLFYNPYIFLIGLLSFYVSIKVTRYVSISSTFAAFMIFLSTTLYNIYFLEEFNFAFFFVILFLFLFIVFRHRSNYRNLINGTENKVGEKKE